MTIHPIGAASVALYLAPEDLEERGLDPAALTLEEALPLARSALRQAGLPLEGTVEIEAYPERSGVLVFAHVRPRDRAWFAFDRLETLAAAARTLGPAPPEDAALFWGEGRWWLSLDGAEEGAAARLSEFGGAEAPPAGPGGPVWERNALARVLTYYPV